MWGSGSAFAQIVGHDLRLSFVSVAAQREASKPHGKLRTKFDRLVLPMHLVNGCCGQATNEAATEGFALDGPDLRFAQTHTQLLAHPSMFGGDWGQDFNPSSLVQKHVDEVTYALRENFEEIWKLLDFAKRFACVAGG
eukprot:s1269_g9.t1